MGRLTVSFVAVSVVLVALEIECSSNLCAQNESNARIVAPDLSLAKVSTESPSAVPQELTEAPSDETKQKGDQSAESADKIKPKQSFGQAFFSNPLNLVLVALVAVYLAIFLLPKPGRKEQLALQQRLANLKKNDRVVLSSGIHGVVANVSSESSTVTIRVDESSNAKLTVDRSAIRSVEA